MHLRNLDSIPSTTWLPAHRTTGSSSEQTKKVSGELSNFILKTTKFILFFVHTWQCSGIEPYPLYSCFNPSNFILIVDFLVGVGNLQRTSSQRSTLTYQRNNYALNTTATYAEPYRPIQYRVQECNYNRLQHATPADDGTTRSPSIDSIQKDPRQVLDLNFLFM